MSTVVKDLGPVTAYADAVAAGYTGTKEEWQALMASYASVAEEAQEAKEGAEAAQEAAEDARDAAITAKNGAESAVSGFSTVVTQATNQAVQTVRAEGTTQVGNVSSEGTTQVNAVQAKGAEVIQSIPADYTELSNDVTQLKEDLDDLDEYVYDNRNIEVESLTPGVFESSGYGALSSTKWVHTEKFDAGSYVIAPPSGWSFEIYAYNSDTSGTLIYSTSGMTRTFTTELPFVMSGRKTDNTVYTSAELEAARTGFSIVKHSGNGNNISKQISDLKQLNNIFRYDIVSKNTQWVISLMQNSVSSDNTGIRTYIFPVFSPTRIYVSDPTLLVRINRYSTFLTFTGTRIETLRDYANSCDYIVSADTYPIYIAVGVRKADLSEFTESDLTTISGEVTIKSIEASAYPYTDISMFKTFGVAGDSWTAGTIYNIDHTIGVTRTGQGWGENLARQHGVTCINFAVGGTSVRTWYNYNDGVIDGGLKAVLEADAVGLYILSMGGSNDWHSGADGDRGWDIGADDPTDTSTYYMGAITDISGYNDYNDYPLTFYGYYGRIIEQIQEHAPNSRIIITSPNTYPTTSERCSACYTAVAEIAEYYNLPYMNLWSDSYYEIWRNTDLLNGSHPVASTYAGMANAIGRLFAKVVEENWEYFREYNGELVTVPVTWSELVKS